MRTYLGDGVSVDLASGDSIVLRYEHPETGGVCAIYLNGRVFNALLQYVEHLGGDTPQPVRGTTRQLNATQKEDSHG